MHEVIQQLVAVEAEAQRQAQELAARGRDATRAAAEQLIAAAIAEAERDKQVRLAQAGREIGEQVRLDDATQEQVIAAMVRCVSCAT